jgi:hypothetical protein
MPHGANGKSIGGIFAEEESAVRTLLMIAQKMEIDAPYRSR